MKIKNLKILIAAIIISFSIYSCADDEPEISSSPSETTNFSETINLLTKGNSKIWNIS